MSFNMRSLAGLFMLESAAAFPGQIMGKGYIPTNMSVPMLNASLLPLSAVPDAIDWSTQGATTEIRNQGSSSYLFRGIMRWGYLSWISRMDIAATPQTTPPIISNLLLILGV